MDLGMTLFLLAIVASSVAGYLQWVEIRRLGVINDALRSAVHRHRNNLTQVEERESAVRKLEEAIDVRQSMLGPIEKMSSQIEVYRDRYDVMRFQIEPLRRIAVAAQDFVDSVDSNDTIMIEGRLFGLRRAIGTTRWLPQEPRQAPMKVARAIMPQARDEAPTDPEVA
jgi:hypothetical protein